MNLSNYKKIVLVIKTGSAFCFMSGICWLVGWTLDLHRDSMLGACIVLAGYVFSTFAFTAIAAVHATRLGLIGFIGYLLTTMAAVLFVPWAFLDISRLSGITPGVDWFYVERNGPTGIIAVLGGFGFVAGYLLLGSGLIRAKVLHPLPAYLLLIAAIQPLIFPLIEIGKLLPRIAGISLIIYAFLIWKYSVQFNANDPRK